jgi:hypothetical protein
MGGLLSSVVRLLAATGDFFWLDLLELNNAEKVFLDKRIGYKRG